MTNTKHETMTWYERYGELTRQGFLQGEDAMPENDRIFLQRMDAAIDCLGLEAVETLLGKASWHEIEDEDVDELPPTHLVGTVSAPTGLPLRLAAQTEERRSPLYDLLQASNREITAGELVDLPAECRHLREHVLLRIVESPQRRVKVTVPESLTLCLKLTEFPVYYTPGTDVPLLEPMVLRAAHVSFGEDALRGRTITIGIG